MRYNSITAIGTLSNVNADTGDCFRLDPDACTGGSMPELRPVVEDKPGGDGSLNFPALTGAWIITLSGFLLIRSAGDEAGYFAAMDTLEASLLSALNAMRAAPANVVSSSGTLSCWLYSKATDQWEQALLTKRYTFSLVVET